MHRKCTTSMTRCDNVTTPPMIRVLPDIGGFVIEQTITDQVERPTYDTVRRIALKQLKQKQESHKGV